MPIENGMISSSVENAQKKLESRNFGIRKNVLQYDDVLNRQREIIYTQRGQVLNGENLKEQIRKMIAETDRVQRPKIPAQGFHPGKLEPGRAAGFLFGLADCAGGFDNLPPKRLETLDPEFVVKQLTDRAYQLYDKREAEYGSELMRELERVILLKNVDIQWMDHIDAMEELKQGISLRAYAQRDPVVEYRIEGFDMFDAMVETIRQDTARMVLTVRIRTQEEPKREQVAKPAAPAGDGTANNRTVRKSKKVGRNDPCPCGSGKKYKKCCGRDL